MPGKIFIIILRTTVSAISTGAGAKQPLVFRAIHRSYLTFPNNWEIESVDVNGNLFRTKQDAKLP
jgi:hypothetical protein